MATGTWASRSGLRTIRGQIATLPRLFERLTRIHTRSVEQVVDLEDKNEVYNWPWLYAVQVGEWGLTQPQAKILRDYLLRGRVLHGRRFPRN